MPRFIRQIEKILAAKIQFDLPNISHCALQHMHSASHNFFCLLFVSFPRIYFPPFHHSKVIGILHGLLANAVFYMNFFISPMHSSTSSMIHHY